jgi:hypothetical protein
MHVVRRVGGSQCHIVNVLFNKYNVHISMQPFYRDTFIANSMRLFYIQTDERQMVHNHNKQTNKFYIPLLQDAS